MRKIKFRAWDKKSKCWYANELTWYGFHIFGECTTFCKPSLEDISNMEITQYTGLKDKNGKEIYEGDIVKTGYSSELNTCIFVAGGFKLSNNFGEMDIYHNGISEIIGNIYENPELLNPQPAKR